MNSVIKLLEEKYGKWSKTPNYIYNHHVPECGKQAFLNIVYTNDCFKDIYKFFKDHKLYMNSSLEKFYKNYNGLSLFAHSLKLYGYQPTRVNDQAPLDFVRTNDMRLGRYPKIDPMYFSIGSYASFNFCLLQGDKSGTIYVVDCTRNLVVKEYNDIEKLIYDCVLKIEKYYDANGMLKGNKDSSWYYNICLEDIFYH